MSYEIYVLSEIIQGMETKEFLCGGCEAAADGPGFVFIDEVVHDDGCIFNNTAAPTKGVDYRALLLKYIKLVKVCEGIDFIDSRRSEVRTDIEFTDQEWAELERLSRRVANDGPADNVKYLGVTENGTQYKP